MVSLTNRALVSFIVEDNFTGLHHLLESRRVAVDDRDEVAYILYIPVDLVNSQ